MKNIKNKKIVYKIMITFLMLFPLRALALSATPSLTCDSAYLCVGDTATCTISVKVTSGSLSSFSGKIDFSSNFGNLNPSTNSVWEGNGEVGNYQLYTDTLKTGTVAIGSFSVKINSTSQNETYVSVKNISLGDETYNEVAKSDLKKTFTILLRGDTNGDNEVTIADVSKIYSYIRGTLQNIDEKYLYAADVNKDKNNTIADVSKIYSYVRKTIGEL